ncbi:MAG: ribosome-binding factor A [Candidatus Portnoybacteria bacterium]|nr:ribosome-binding factor A [Candidatus Portnoybacteria bacterium]MDD4982764.1 ribosome-binding factor A [Candidatus Portnoybacteria bacterium]
MSHKIAKVNELIKQELNGILLREEEFGEGVLATILAVETTEDQLEAKIIFSVWPENKGAEVLKKLNAHIWHLQQAINKRLQIHPVPKMRFVINTDEAASQHIEEIIKKVGL